MRTQKRSVPTISLLGHEHGVGRDQAAPCTATRFMVGVAKRIPPALGDETRGPGHRPDDDDRQEESAERARRPRSRTRGAQRLAAHSMAAATRPRRARAVTQSGWTVEVAKSPSSRKAVRRAKTTKAARCRDQIRPGAMRRRRSRSRRGGARRAGDRRRATQLPSTSRSRGAAGRSSSARACRPTTSGRRLRAPSC